VTLRGPLAALLLWSLAAGPVLAAPLRGPSVELPPSAAEPPLAAAALSAGAAASGPQAPSAAPQAAALDRALEPASSEGPPGSAAVSALEKTFDGSGFLAAFQPPEPFSRFTFSSYVEPNELHPEHARPIFEKAQPGAYVSVGTERSFVGAAAAGATHLVLVDRDPAVASYNRANAELLRLAADREQYLALRRTSLDGVLRVARLRGWSDERVRRLHDDLKVFHPAQRDHILHDTSGLAFAGVNYLRDDTLFSRLKSIADAGRIAVLNMRLDDEPLAAAMTEALADAGARLGVLDVSNAWYTQYMGERPFAELVATMSRIADSRSIVMVTDGWRGAWRYHGFLPYSESNGQVVAADLTKTLYGLDNDKTNGVLRRVKPRARDFQ